VFPDNANFRPIIERGCHRWFWCLPWFDEEVIEATYKWIIRNG
jgi:hypothetical protein